MRGVASKRLIELERALVSGVEVGSLRPYSEAAEGYRSRPVGAGKHLTMCVTCMSEGPLPGIPFEFRGFDVREPAELLREHYAKFHPNGAKP